MTASSVPVNIKVTSDELDSNFNMSVPENLYDKLRSYSRICVKVGAARKEVNFTSNGTKDTIVITGALSKELALYSNLKTNFSLKENELRLGPVIGSFTDSTSVRMASENRPGNKLKNLGSVNSEANTILYFFSVGDFYYEKQMIKGTYYNFDTEQWEQRLFPLPDVLYDRGGSSLKSQTEESEKIREIIEGCEDVKKFNPIYLFDKWDAHRRLIKFKELVPYMPHTIRYTDSKDLFKMLQKYSVLYVKDRRGNRGLGVVRIIRLSDNEFELSYFKKELFVYKINSFEELANKIDEILKGKRLIIQSGIDTIQFNNGNVDMRATVQRDKEGKLGVTALPVRVGKSGAPITSTRSGSEVYRFEDFFAQFLKYSSDEIAKLKMQVEEFLLAAYKRIEEEYGTFGEIGIDFAIDNDGHVWFIECNAKPGKDTVFLSYDAETVKRSFLNPLEYAKYISGF